MSHKIAPAPVSTTYYTPTPKHKFDIPYNAAKQDETGAGGSKASRGSCCGRKTDYNPGCDISGHGLI